MAWPEKYLSDLSEGDLFTISDMENATVYKHIETQEYEDEDGNVDEDRVMISATRVRDGATRHIEFEISDPVYIKPTIIYPQRKVRL